MGTGEDTDVEESMVDVDKESIRDAVDSAPRDRGFDGYQVLPEGNIFIQSISGRGKAENTCIPLVLVFSLTMRESYR